MRSNRTPVALTITGSDPAGATGVETDLKTFSILGVHGTAAVTSIITRNTSAETIFYDLPNKLVYEQIKLVYENMSIDAAKTSMLRNAETIAIIADAVKDFNIKLVVDPVMTIDSGVRVMREEVFNILKERLLPLAFIATLDVSEAQILAGFKIESVEDVAKAVRFIHEKYNVSGVVVEGYYLDHREAVDTLYYDGEVYYFKSNMPSNECFYGARHVFSAAITAFLAKGMDIAESIKHTRELINLAIDYGVRIDKDHCLANPVAYLEIPALKYKAIENVRKAVKILLQNQEMILPYAPEVGINIVEAIDARYARSVFDVAGVEGRIVRAGEKLVKVGDIKMGGSSHLARLVLALLRKGFNIHGAVNVRYDQSLIEKARDKRYRVVFVDRAREPPEIKSAPKGTMEWIATQIPIEEAPDIIYDVGDVGKEAMIRILGRDALEAVEKLTNILK